MASKTQKELVEEELKEAPYTPVRGLLTELGFAPTQGDLDEALRWALVELMLRRVSQDNQIPEEP